MINIINEFNENIMKFDSYTEVCTAFHNIENCKILEDVDGEIFKNSWGFFLHDKRTLKHLHDNLTWVPPLLKEAYDREIGLIELCKGDPFNLTQILITPEVDIEKIRKAWCLDYCEEKGWRLEIINENN